MGRPRDHAAITVIINDDLDACRSILQPALALYVGGMGARDKNFYSSHISRQRWPAEAETIQDLFLDGKNKKAAAAVPHDMVDGVALVGPVGRVGRVRDKVAGPGPLRFSSELTRDPCRDGPLRKQPMPHVEQPIPNISPKPQSLLGNRTTGSRSFFDENGREEEASPSAPSWKQIVSWLREVETLRRAAG